LKNNLPSQGEGDHSSQQKSSQISDVKKLEESVPKEQSTEEKESEQEGIKLKIYRIRPRNRPGRLYMKIW
jgi:hypothetical protein